MADSQPKKAAKKATKKPASAQRRGRDKSTPATDPAAAPTPGPRTETVETHSEVTEQHGWRITRTRRTTTSEAKTIEADGRERTETTVHVDEVEGVVPVPYQGPAAPAGHPRPVG